MRTIKTLVTVILFALLSTSLAQANDADDHMAAEILAYVNQYRVQHGLPQLSMSYALSQEAYKHSRDMATHTLPFGHDGFERRMQRLHHEIPQSSSGAENVAYNYKSARIVVDGWIHSPGHRQNMVGHYNLTGIGIARDRQGRIYYTQMFLRADDRGIAQGDVAVHTHPQVLVHHAYRHGHRDSF